MPNENEYAKMHWVLPCHADDRGAGAAQKNPHGNHLCLSRARQTNQLIEFHICQATSLDQKVMQCSSRR